MTIPSPPDPDDDTLARIARGDPRSVREFVKCYARPVSAKLATMGLLDHESQDVAHESFMEAIRGIGGYEREKGRFITWLLTIARNRAIDFLRRLGRIGEDGRYVPREVSLEMLEDGLRRSAMKKTGPTTPDEIALSKYVTTQGGVGSSEASEEGKGWKSILQRAVPEFEAWLAARPEADRIAAQGLLYGTPWESVAKDLSEFRGRSVNANAAKQHGDRLKKRIRAELAYLFDPADYKGAAVAGDSEESPIDLEGVR